METRELALKLFDEENPVLLLITCGELDRNRHMARYDKIANAYLAGFVKGVEACIVKGCEYGVVVDVDKLHQKLNIKIKE